MPHFMFYDRINTLYQFINLFWMKKKKSFIFEEYGDFNEYTYLEQVWMALLLW